MNHEVPAGRKTGFIQATLKAVPTLLVLIVMGGGWLFMHHINSTSESTEEAAETPSAEEAQAVDTLVLPPGKLKAGGFESIPAESHSVQHVHTVPGRLRYDERKHVAVKAPMDGILAEVLVTPGNTVKAGQLLAVIRSSEIGQARAEILKRRQQLEIAQMVLARERTLAENVRLLSEMLDAGKSADAIEQDFKDRPLGAYRGEILSSYSKMLLAAELIAKVKPLVSSGSVPGRTLRERENDRRLAETSFRTACDQATFSVEQAELKAESDAAEASRQLDLAWQSLEGLLGYKEERATSNLLDDNALSRLEVRAPFTGSVESRDYANEERVSRGDSLFVLANTDSLDVEASIREGDWSTVTLQPGTSIIVRIPALEDREFEARVRYFGRKVHSDTNSVPLIAAIDNSEGLLRPGMFVRVTVPIGPPRTALSVKPESVIQHENQEFVFLDMQGGSFQRVNVMTGQSSADWIEVTSGLSPGQLVVTNGAFLLKSELLLQGEGE